LIIGKNGSGKSTLLDALTFSLFGKAYRNINKPSLVNSINQKDCVVELEFIIGKKPYTIRRGLKPNVFDVVVDGDELDKTASVIDFQNNLENNILKMNYKSFCSVVILGARYDSFMNMTPADRRKVVEDVLDIEIFSDMNVLLKDRLSKLKEKIQTNETELRLNLEKQNLQKSNIETTIKEREEDIKEKTTKRDFTQGQVDVLWDDIHKDVLKLDDIVKEIDIKKPPLEAKQKEANEVFRDLRKTHNKTKKELQFFTDHTSCPTCEQGIIESFRKDMIDTKEDKSKELVSAMDSLLKKIGEVDIQIEDVGLIEDGEHILRTKIDKKQKVRDAWISTVNGLDGQIRALNNRQEAVHTDDRAQVLEEIETHVVELDLNKQRLGDRKRSHDVAYDLLKDSGIKARIIENYLPVINSQINQHLRDLDFYIKIELDETFNETIKSRHLDEFSYDSFSEGEKARIDLALLFTWRKIAELKNSVNTNLLILDEVFDGSLDAIGADEVMTKLLFNQGQHFDGLSDTSSNAKTNIFVISHKVDLVDKFEHTIKFEKVRGFSQKEQ
jgi:DNA repair exonuclease SbcCD ATPase subunit